jgi:two-component system response regulator MprA
VGVPGAAFSAGVAILEDVEAARVLVIEDDASLRGTVDRGLREHGLSVATVGDGGSALAHIEDDPDGFAVIVLDIGLPDSDGRDVCQALRARGIQTPVLFLTARGQVGDVLSGFAAGGDDYLAKPFHFGELLARVTALARRAETAAGAGPAQAHLDPRTHSLVSASGSHPLTPTEYRLLAALMAAPGEVVRRRALLRAAWPDGAMVSDNTLDQYVARIRRKLAAADDTVSIVTAHGVGYRLG